MKAAIFDVDGTLLDSMSVWEDIGERYLASQNITAEKNLRAALRTMSLEQGAAWMKEKYQLDKIGRAHVNSSHSAKSRMPSSA